jgi:hypothetical protein
MVPLQLLLREKTGGGPHEDGEDTERGDGRREAEFCLEWRKGDGVVDREAGVPGLDVGMRPSSFRPFDITDWRRVSGPKANRIISFSPWSWIKRRPMIFAAFSGSKVWILEKTILVASYASMEVVWCMLSECLNFMGVEQFLFQYGEEKGKKVSIEGYHIERESNKRDGKQCSIIFLLALSFISLAISLGTLLHWESRLYWLHFQS